MLYFQLTIVLLAFAANSLLCRWALDVHQFDPALFSLIRLASGAVILSILLRRFAPPGSKVNIMPWRERRFWKLGVALAIYALGFSWAYLRLDTGIGAFILFATIQIVMQFAAFLLGSLICVAMGRHHHFIYRFRLVIIARCSGSGSVFRWADVYCGPGLELVCDAGQAITTATAGCAASLYGRLCNHAGVIPCVIARVAALALDALATGIVIGRCGFRFRLFPLVSYFTQAGIK